MRHFHADPVKQLKEATFEPCPSSPRPSWPTWNAPHGPPTPPTSPVFDQCRLPMWPDCVPSPPPPSRLGMGLHNRALNPFSLFHHSFLLLSSIFLARGTCERGGGADGVQRERRLHRRLPRCPLQLERSVCTHDGRPGVCVCAVCV